MAKSKEEGNREISQVAGQTDIQHKHPKPGKVSVPKVPLPKIAIPDVTIPTVSLPEITVPQVPIPSIALPARPKGKQSAGGEQETELKGGAPEQKPLPTAGIPAAAIKPPDIKFPTIRPPMIRPPVIRPPGALNPQPKPEGNSQEEVDSRTPKQET